MLAREAVKEAEEIIKPKGKKLKIKLTLQEATEATEALDETIPVVKKTNAKTIRKKKSELEEVPNVLAEGEGIDITKTKPKTTRKKKIE